METSSFKQAIEAQFDCLSKKVIKRAVKKGYCTSFLLVCNNLKIKIHQYFVR